MADILVVVDMQNDFIDGSLGTPEAVKIVRPVAEKIKNFNGDVYYTRDTHTEDYPHTQEGHFLPVLHCIRESYGWQITEKIPLPKDDEHIIDKGTFGSLELARRMLSLSVDGKVSSITLVGLCTDICVISNALLLKASLPEIPITVDASCCAGVTPESHANALKAMEACQIIIK
ncbi:MAG: cysteine hydrolase [Sphaerochaetaceae bacterium]|nr:cysteine hydrolase [Sphaerochaetaceae bacterium]